MKSLTTDLRQQFEAELSTLTWLVKVTRKDGVVLGFTAFDRDLALEGVTYEAESALQPSELEVSGGTRVDNFSVMGVLNSEKITEDDLRAGRFDAARVDVYRANWQQPTQHLHTGRYFIGEVTYSEGRFQAELLGLKELMQKETGRYITRTCSVDFGSPQCGIDREQYRVDSAVTSPSGDNDAFFDTARQEEVNWWMYGVVTFTSGENKGITRDIKESGSNDNYGGWIRTWEPWPFPIAEGDTYTLYPGCDKTLKMCRDRYGNGLNFRGFPHVPGSTQALQYPDARG